MLFGPEAFEDIICDNNERISSLSHGIKNRLFIFESPRNEEKCLLAAGILPSIVDPMLVKKSLNEFAVSNSVLLILLPWNNFVGRALFFLETFINVRIPSQVFLTLPWCSSKKEL